MLEVWVHIQAHMHALALASCADIRAALHVAYAIIQDDRSLVRLKVLFRSAPRRCCHFSSRDARSSAANWTLLRYILMLLSAHMHSVTLLDERKTQKRLGRVLNVWT